MRLIGLAMAVILGFALVSLDAEGQRSSKIPRIGVLAVGGGPRAVIDAFLLGLRDLGWVDGQNVIIERRNADGREERLPALAAELIDLTSARPVFRGQVSRGCWSGSSRRAFRLPVVDAIAADGVRRGSSGLRAGSSSSRRRSPSRERAP